MERAPQLLPSDLDATRQTSCGRLGLPVPRADGPPRARHVRGLVLREGAPGADGGWLAWLRAHAGRLQIVTAALFIGSLILSGHRDNLQLYNGWYFHYARDVLPTVAFAALIVCAALSGPRAQLPWTNRFMRWVGDISYGAYLWHGMVVWSRCGSSAGSRARPRSARSCGPSSATRSS